MTVILSSKSTVDYVPNRKESRFYPFGAEPVRDQALMRKHPVSIVLSNRVLEKIVQEASKQKRSRSEFIELHFETLFFVQQELEN